MATREIPCQGFKSTQKNFVHRLQFQSLHRSDLFGRDARPGRHAASAGQSGRRRSSSAHHGHH